MSKPVNHHFVSQCHLREFFDFDSKRIYLYDKIRSNLYRKNGTRYIFSMDYLNNRLINDEVDQESMELELRVMFEDNFSKHLQSVKRIYNDHSLVGDAYNDLNYLALMALVGEYRNPEYKQGLDGVFDSMDEQLKIRGGKISKKTKNELIPYSNQKGYIDVAFLMLEKMDPITFAIVSIKSDDHFIIPDTSGFLVRSNFDTGQVVQFGLPVSDKLFILGRSAVMGLYPTTLVEINDNNDDLVFKINSDLINYSYQTVACKDEIFLRDTISKMHGVKFIGQYFYGTTIGSPEREQEESPQK